MNEFLLKIKNCVDRLGSVSHAVSENDHIKAIFDSLTSECDTFMVFVNSRTDSCSVEEIE